MKTVYGLTPHEAKRLPVVVYLRYVMTRSSGTWDSRRVRSVLQYRGWDTTSAYPLNFAGNMLLRLEKLGAMVKVERGVYESVPEAIHRIQIIGLSRCKERLSPKLYAKMLDWTPYHEPEQWS